MPPPHLLPHLHLCTRLCALAAACVFSLPPPPVSPSSPSSASVHCGLLHCCMMPAQFAPLLHRSGTITAIEAHGLCSALPCCDTCSAHGLCSALWPCPPFTASPQGALGMGDTSFVLTFNEPMLLGALGSGNVFLTPAQGRSFTVLRSSITITGTPYLIEN